MRNYSTIRHNGRKEGGGYYDRKLQHHADYRPVLSDRQREERVAYLADQYALQSALWDTGGDTEEEFLVVDVQSPLDSLAPLREPMDAHLANMLPDLTGCFFYLVHNDNRHVWQNGFSK